MSIEIIDSSISLSFGVIDFVILLFTIFEIINWRQTGIPITYRIFLYYMIKSQIERNYLPKSWEIRSLFWMIKYKSFTVFLMDSYNDDLYVYHASATGYLSHFGKIKSNNIINQIKIKELTDPIQVKRDKKLRELGL
jgi:hypothetical protein